MVEFIIRNMKTSYEYGCEVFDFGFEFEYILIYAGAVYDYGYCQNGGVSLIDVEVMVT